MQKLFYQYQEKWQRFWERVKKGVLRALAYSTYPFEIVMEWIGWILRYFGGGLIRMVTYPFVALSYRLRPA
ncbi:MAG: hypothetical protein AAF497_06880, partial [Planctomycetota bacterium]